MNLPFTLRFCFVLSFLWQVGIQGFHDLAPSCLSSFISQTSRTFTVHPIKLGLFHFTCVCGRNTFPDSSCSDPPPCQAGPVFAYITKPWRNYFSPSKWLQIFFPVSILIYFVHSVFYFYDFVYISHFFLLDISIERAGAFIFMRSK